VRVVAVVAVAVEAEVRRGLAAIALPEAAAVRAVVWGGRSAVMAVLAVAIAVGGPLVAIAPPEPGARPAAAVGAGVVRGLAVVAVAEGGLGAAVLVL
jgi:hypothetical protein